MKILITGFCPFGANKINSSWEIAKTISGDEFDGVELIIKQLPVSFISVKHSIDDLIATCNPDVFIMLGQTSKSNEIRLERVAINMMDASMPDNDGMTPDEDPIIKGGLPAYFSTVPIKVLKKELKEEGLPVRISNSAGTYVCNTTYYYALHKNQILGNKMRALFVHLPLIKGNNDNQTDVGLPFEIMKQTVVRIIKFMAGLKI